MDQKTLNDLIDKVNNGTATDEELHAYNAYLNQATAHDPAWASAQLGEEEVTRKSLLNSINEQTGYPTHAKTRLLWPRIAAAASIIVACSIGGYLLLKQPKTPQLAQNDAEQMAPLQNGVTLTLAKGQQIRLDNKHRGQIAANIHQHYSTLDYTPTGAAGQPGTNTLTNNGSTKFSVTLADGTDAILDIGSSLTYPVAFHGNTRQVNMTGQVYFKVKHSSAQHFSVRYAGQLAEDIGTEFNIDAYPDGIPKTTLIEGSVKVSLNNSTAAITLKPGEQAIAEDNTLKSTPVKLEDVTAWLQGKLVFHNEPLESILKKVARIYGVEIIYQDPELRKVTYYGSVNTTKKLAAVLNFFRKAGQVDFVVEGKTVKVFKQKRK